MRSLRKELADAGYSLTTLAEFWSLHRKTVTCIVDGNIKKESDHLYRWFFCRAASLEIDPETAEKIKRFPMPVRENSASAIEQHIHRLRSYVTDSMAEVGFSGQAGARLFEIGRRVDELNALLGLSKDRPFHGPDEDANASKRPQRG